jgi:beta-xylosidase
MNSEGSLANNDDILLLDGHQDEPTVEGPKLYKKNSFYYIFAPAGGVATGWQTVLRSTNIYGPYEKKKVLIQGNTNINGPHQGAWVQTQTGSDWFIHFQDKGVVGRVVHLQPMHWKNDWPVIGNDADRDGIGEPVTTYTNPIINKQKSFDFIQSSDEFNSVQLGLQWQWHANPKLYYGFPTNLGYFMLNCIPKPKEYHNLYEVPNLLLQKFPSAHFTATAKLTFMPNFDNEESGLVVMGTDYCLLRLKQRNGKLALSQLICKNADQKNTEEEMGSVELSNNSVYLKVSVEENGVCTFYYSEEGTNYIRIGLPFQAKEGKWIGAKLGFVALREGITNDAGNLQIDWIRFN